MTITREDLLKRRHAIAVRREEALAIVNQAGGALLILDALLKELPEGGTVEATVITEAPAAAANGADTPETVQ
jgi:hypothetical protein